MDTRVIIVRAGLINGDDRDDMAAMRDSYDIINKKELSELDRAFLDYHFNYSDPLKYVIAIGDLKYGDFIEKTVNVFGVKSA